MKKPIVIILGGILLFISLFIGGVYSFSKHIYNRTDCAMFNIDNIELRTGINIPQIVSSECDCKDVPKMKESTFILDVTKVNLEDYIQKNGFQIVDNQYIAKFDNENTKWEAILDEQTAKLSFTIHYKL